MSDKHRAQQRGRWAETKAVWFLRAKGYRVLGRNIRTPVGEIDIVAKRGNLLCFVEVKARTTLDGAAFALQPAQQRRIIRAAQAYLQSRPHLQSCDIRFDAVWIAPYRWPQHLADAWRA